MPPQTPGSAPVASDDKLGRLFSGLFDDAHGDAITDGQLVEQLRRGRAGKQLSSRQRGVVDVGRQILRDFLDQPAFHADFRALLAQHSGALVAEGLPRDGWLSRKRHPLLSWLDLLGQLAMGWEPGHPQAGEIHDTVAGWCARLADGAGADAVLAEAQQWLKRFRERADRLGERLCAAESGALKVQYARHLAARTVNRQLAGRPLPDFMVAWITEAWFPGLQWVLLNHGEGSALWSQAVRTLTLMFWSLQPEAAQESQRRKLDRVASQLKAELPELMRTMLADETVGARQFEDIQIAHLAARHGRELEFVDVPPLDGGGALETGAEDVSRDLLAEIRQLSTDDWFELRETGQRLRLLLRQDEYRQLLFVNQAGIKALTCSFEEFAWKLSSGEFRPLPLPVAAPDLVAERLNILAQQYRDQQREYRDREEQRRRRAAEEEKARLAAREKALAEARRIQEQQQVQETEQRIEEERKDREEQDRREQLAERMGSSEAERRQKARLLVSGLPIGVWVAFRGERGEEQHRRLTVVLPSSGKYIFVDRRGGDRYELPRRELIEAIAAGQAVVMQKDSRFDDALNRVVDGLRQHKARVHEAKG